MYKSLILTALSFILISTTIRGQSTAPSLQAGLGGITFEKGDLNSEVIAKLIAEKQEELKVQLIQSMLLKDLDNSGGVIFSYANEILSAVLSGSSTQVKIRNIAENTVNIAVVMAFVNHYVGVASDEERKNLVKLAISLGYVLPTNYKEINPPSSLVDLIQKPYYNPQNELIGNQSDRVNINTFNTESFIELATLLIDITAVALQNNEVLKERGLFRFSMTEGYKSSNKYLTLNRSDAKITDFTFLRTYAPINQALKNIKEAEDSIISKKKVLITDSLGSETLETDIDSLKKIITEQEDIIKSNIGSVKSKLGKATPGYADLVYRDIHNYVDAYVNAFGVFDFIYRNDLNIRKIDPSLAESIRGLANDLKTNIPEISTINSLTVSVYLDLISKLKRLATELPEDDRAELEEIFQKMEQFLLKNEVLADERLHKVEQVYLIGNELLPKVRKIVSMSGNNSNIEQILYYLELTMVADMIEELVDTLKLSPTEVDDYRAFYRLFGAIQNLDDADSYEQFFKSFYSSLDVLADGKIKTTLEQIVHLTSNHVEFVKSDSTDYVNVDVEGILVSLSEMNYDRFQWLKFYFTVGGNYMLLTKPVNPTADQEVRNFQYFGEKIGFKIKLYDWAYLRSFSPGETFTYWGRTYIRKKSPSKPVINDIHFLAYGSGLLYNLAGTSSESVIDNALLGAGIGLSFNAGLDFNITTGKILGFGDNGTFLKAGIDIRFMEYIQALGKN